MNTFFDIKRFGLMLRYDAVTGSRQSLSYMLGVAVGFYVMMFLNSYRALFNAGSIDAQRVRVDGIAMSLLFLMMLVSVISPCLVCSRIGEKARATAFWSLPASPFEKFLARYLMSAFGTVVLAVCSLLAADALFILTCLAAGAPGVTSVSLAMAGIVGDSFEAFVRSELPAKPDGWWFMAVLWLTFVMARALSLLCGVFFRRKALLLTLLLSMAVFMGFIVTDVNWVGSLYRSAYTSPSAAAWLSLCLLAAIVCCCLLAYRLFCRIQIVGRKWVSL